MPRSLRESAAKPPAPPSRTASAGAQRKRRRSADDTRLHLISAARGLVADVGFRDAQMAAVAARADVAIGTLYRHFPGKAELMVEVVQRVSQREVDVIGAIAMGEGTAAERLPKAIWTFASRALAGHRIARALVAEPVDAPIEAMRLSFRRKLARVYETIIEQGIREGDFVSQNVQSAAACIVGSLFEGLVGPLGMDPLATERERRDNTAEIVAFCLRGVSGRPMTFAP